MRVLGAQLPDELVALLTVLLGARERGSKRAVMLARLLRPGVRGHERSR